MLKTTGSSNDLTSEVSGANNNEVVGGGDGKADKMGKNSSKSKKSKNEKSENSTHIRAMEEPMFLTSGAKEAFNYLRQAFIKAPIL